MLLDVVNGLYRAGFAYQQQTFSANNTALTLDSVTSSATVSLTIPQMIEAATLSIQLQIVNDTASKNFTATLSRNGNTTAVYKMNSNIGSEVPPNSFIIVDTSIPLNGACFAGDIFLWTIDEPGIAGGNSTIFSATVSVTGAPA